MYTYAINYETEELSVNTHLVHDKYFSKDEFKNVVANAYANVYTLNKEKYNSNITIDFIYGETIRFLVDNLGFKDLEPVVSVTDYGWLCLDDPEHYSWDNPFHTRYMGVAKLVHQKIKSIEESKRPIGFQEIIKNNKDY